jgi:hypothetical protein
VVACRREFGYGLFVHSNLSHVFLRFPTNRFYSFRVTTRFANSEQRRMSRLEFLLEERERLRAGLEEIERSLLMIEVKTTLNRKEGRFLRPPRQWLVASAWMVLNRRDFLFIQPSLASALDTDDLEQN